MQTETQLDALAPYSEIRAKIEALKAENAAKSFDITTKSGEKAARSHIYVLRQRKADVERIRKAAGADALEYKRKVDAVGKEIIGEIESMIDVHQKPLDEIEQREAARKAAHEARLAELQVPEGVIADAASCRAIRDRIAAVTINGEWEEYKPAAVAAQAASLKTLDARLAELERMEAEQAELARLRKEAAEREERERKEREAREQAEREERIRRDAEEKARREAEEAAERARKAEAEKAMAEARRKEAEAQAAIEAERKKAEEAKAEAERVKRMAQEREAELAAQAKRQREEEERRKADQQHREKILDEVAYSIAGLCEDAAPEVFARHIAQAIAEGNVPHTSIKF